MKKKIIVFIISIMLVIIGIPLVSPTATHSETKDGTTDVSLDSSNSKRTSLYVDINGGAQYIHIQDAIDNASAGDTIYVSNGIYYENIQIDKPLSLIGEAKESTIIDGSGNGNVVTVTGNTVTMSTFTVRNGGAYGIYLDTTSDTTIDTCAITENILFGIKVVNSVHCTIQYTQSHHNHRYGIYLVSSPHCTIINCDAFENDNPNYHDHGIVVLASGNTTIDHCTSYNNYYGIYLDSSPYGRVTNCTTYGNAGYGIHLMYKSNHSLIENCVTHHNTGFGVYIEFTSYCQVINCVSYNNMVGVFLNNNVLYSTITCCTVYSNSWAGIILRGGASNNLVTRCTANENEYGIVVYYMSGGNILYKNNIISNLYNVYAEGPNQWDNGQEGNYWSDYQGKDYNGDGIGDTPYSNGTVIPDYFPLMHRFILGDMNVDGMVDFADINPFVLALSNPAEYQTYYHLLASLHGDCNQDGVLNFGDINLFVALLTTGHYP